MKKTPFALSLWAEMSSPTGINANSATAAIDADDRTNIATANYCSAPPSTSASLLPFLGPCAFARRRYTVPLAHQGRTLGPQDVQSLDNKVPAPIDLPSLVRLSFLALCKQLLSLVRKTLHL